MRSFNEEIAILHRLGHKGQGALIGHLDTGVDGEHPALHGRIALFKEFGYRGHEKSPRAPYDSSWHGTHTAGILVGNSKDKTLGIAPSASLCSGMVIEEGNIVARILKGLDWLLECRVHVVSLSLGVYTNTPIFRSLIKKMVQQGIIVVCSLGNRGAGKVSSPGFYPETIGVGAATADGKVTSFSGSYHHYGTVECHKPDVVAPGISIFSTVPNGGFEKKNGTSMSSAQVAGLVALITASFPHLGSKVIKNILLKSAYPLDINQGHRSARGMVSPINTFDLLNKFTSNQMDDLENANYWELKYPKKYIDPRLEKQLGLGDGDRKCEAVFQFCDRLGISQLKQFKAHQNTVRDPVSFFCLKNSPIAIYQGSAKSIGEIIKWPSVIIANACDVDKSSHDAG